MIFTALIDPLRGRLGVYLHTNIPTLYPTRGGAIDWQAAYPIFCIRLRARAITPRIVRRPGGAHNSSSESDTA